MRNFTRVKFWLLLMVMGLVVSSTVAQTEPKVGITPDPLDLGEWPIGGWQENAYLELKVEGQGTVTIDASELDDPQGVFTLTNPALPVSVTALDPAVMVGVAFTAEGVTEQTYNATYVASWGTGKSVTTSEITAFGYTPVTGDIFEDPFVVTLPHVDAGVSTAIPMRSNYNIPGTATNGKDVVYKFTLAEDKEVTINLTNTTETPKMAIYAADFEGEAGPMVSNAVASAGASAVDLPLFAGDYYVVVSAEADDAAMTFDIEISATTMPDPECIINPVPADGTVEIPSNGIVLSWEYGQYVQEYQLVFGTTYPPTDVLMDWTAIDPTGDSYALPNLDPSMQYFWQVNVRNNNATITTCDVYGFTTTLTPPADLTATVQYVADDEYDVLLEWTASAKALLSYNVYRDGVMIATVTEGTEEYLDEDLAYNMNPCYEYYVEAIFDEGVSAPSNTATACITGVGTIDGTITELLTGDPIEGATIELTSQTGGTDYTFNSATDGTYGGEVIEDCYTVTVSADGYITEVEEDVCIDYNTTVTKDYELDEFPYPVSDVVAYEVNDNTVHIDWGNNGNPGGGDPVEFRYDDGISTGQLGSSTGTTNTLLGNVHRVDAELTEMSWYLTSEGGPHNTISIYVLGLDADGIPDGNNVLFTESVSNTDEVWNTYTFDTPIDATGGFFLGVGYNGFAGIGTDDGNEDPYAFIPNTHYFVGDYTAGGWETWETYDFEVNGMIRAMGVPGGKASYAVSTPDIKPNSDLTLIESEAFFTGRPQWKTAKVSADKDLLGYNVYRGSCYSEDDFEFLGYTLDDQFTDNTWNDVDWGVYRWAVEAVYTNNVSERAYSNCLDKDMEAVVNVVVTTNSGDPTEGCDVVFTNTFETEYTYDIEIDENGEGSVDPFRKGMYDYTVSLPGFGEISATDVLVDSDTTFVWQLEELLAPPTDLYVTPTGFATWSGGGAVPFEPFMADFNDGLPEGWEIINDGTSADHTWFWTTDDGGSTLDGTPFMFVDSDAAGSSNTLDEYLISPVINAAGLDELILEFDQYFNNWLGDEFADVDVYDGSTWVNVLAMNGSDVGSWSSPDHQIIDVSAYANADFRVRFHYYNATYDYYWAVDNVNVHDNSGKYAEGKAFQFYKIWHDGVHSNDPDTNFYQYGTNPDVDILVPGETYLAEVATLYSTGLSAKSDYEWTYLPCDSFPGPAAMDAYNVDGSDDVVVVWGEEGSTPGGAAFFDDFESYDDFDIVYSPWTTYDVDEAEPYGFQGISFPNSAEPRAGIIFNPLNTTPALEGPLGVSGDKYLAIFNPMSPLVPADDWNITPQVTIGEDYEVSFYATGGNANYSAEQFQVFVSTGDAVVADMVALSDQVTTPSGSVEWIKYTYDLSEYEGEDVYVGLHCTSFDQFFLCIDDFYVGPADNGKTADESKLTVNVNEELWSTVYAKGEPKGESIAASTKSAKADPVVLGTNVYRDGEMIAFVPASDTFYVDMNLEPGYYDYCVATVYTVDDGAHTWTSCVDANCELDVLVPEDCDAPTNLTAEDLLGDGYTATLNWDAPNAFEPTWLQYGDGTATAQVGGPAEFSVAAKFEVDQIADLDGGAITKINFFYMADANGAVPSFTLRVWTGDAGSNLVYEQPITNANENAWNEITLDTPVELDVSQPVWIGYYIFTNGAYSAGTGDGYPDPNSDWVSLDGSTWEHVTDYVPNVHWALGGYIESAKGQIIPIGTSIDDVAEYSGNGNDLSAGEQSSNIIYPNPFNGNKALMGYNVYRDGQQVNEDLVLETTYADEVGEAGYFCYEVTAVYSVCGESDPSNEACVDVAVGINNIDNNIAVYPNPAKDFVMVEASSDIRSIEVTNYMGQVVNAVKAVEMTQYRINTSALSAGVYFVEVETAAGIEKVRIVISE